MGFVQNRPISITNMNFHKIHGHLGDNHGSVKPTFPKIVVGHFLNLELVVTAQGIGGFEFILLHWVVHV